MGTTTLLVFESRSESKSKNVIMKLDILFGLSR